MGPQHIVGKATTAVAPCIQQPCQALCQAQPDVLPASHHLLVQLVRLSTDLATCNQAWSKLYSAAVSAQAMIMNRSAAIILPCTLLCRFGRALAGQWEPPFCSGCQLLMGGYLYNMSPPCVPAELPRLLPTPGRLWRVFLFWPSGEDWEH